MAPQKRRPTRDIEKNYLSKLFIKKIRRLADCIDQGKRFQIQVAGQRVTIPAGAVISIEHERGISSEELEFQITWTLDR